MLRKTLMTPVMIMRKMLIIKLKLPKKKNSSRSSGDKSTMG